MIVIAVVEPIGRPSGPSRHAWIRRINENECILRRLFALQVRNSILRDEADGRPGTLEVRLDDVRIFVDTDINFRRALVAKHCSASEVRLDVDTMRRYQLDQLLIAPGFSAGIAHARTLVRNDDECKPAVLRFVRTRPDGGHGLDI